MVDDLTERAALDAILLGEESERTAQAWRRLIEQPGGAQAWAAAVERRARIDRAAAVLARAPWLAPLLRQAGRVKRRGAGAASALRDVGARWLPGPPVLARALDAGDVRTVAVAWGEATVVHLAVGERIELRLDEDAAASLWSLGEAGAVALPGRAWQLEQGEAPVVLVVTAGPRGADLDRSAERATAMAIVVIEESSTETG